MNAIRTIRALGPIDIKSVRRDSLLGWMIFMPIMTALIVRWLVPFITTALQNQLGFDLTPYYPVIMSYFFIMFTPMAYGWVIGFLLLDERDDQTLYALQVTPLKLNNYIAYRVVVPFLLSVVMTMVAFPMAGLVTIQWAQLLLISLVAAPIAPFMALLMAAVAQNKVQGFALMKGIGGVMLGPVIAFFIQSNWQILFGLFPTYWAAKVYWLLDAGAPGVWVFVAIGLVYQALLLFVLLNRFDKVMHR